MTLAEQLVAAEATYHQLMIGGSVAEFRDQNGETVRYNKATKGELATYIQSLKDQIAGTAAPGLGPMRVWI